MSRACSDCLTRARLIEALAPRINCMVGMRRPVRQLLALTSRELMDATGVPEPGQRRFLTEAAAAAEADRLRAIDGGVVCIHDDGYPERLRDLPDAPHALFHTGPLSRLDRLLAERPVAIVGSRRP